MRMNLFKLLTISTSFRITNKWIRGKPQELSFPCKIEINGFVRLQPLNRIFCNKDKISSEDCNEDRWSREREVFFIPQLQYDSIKSINDMWYESQRAFYFVWNTLFQKNNKTNQNISTMDIMLAPTHRPIIPPILEMRLILFKRADLVQIKANYLTLRLISPARLFCSTVPWGIFVLKIFMGTDYCLLRTVFNTHPALYFPSYN